MQIAETGGEGEQDARRAYGVNDIGSGIGNKQEACWVEGKRSGMKYSRRERCPGSIGSKF